jgi:enoyl-CoA hydratase
VPAGALPDAVEAMAAELAAKSASASRTVKTLVNRALDVDLASGLEMEAQLAAVHMRGAEAAEGLRAFVEKRTPDFAGR